MLSNEQTAVVPSVAHTFTYTASATNVAAATGVSTTAVIMQDQYIVCALRVVICKSVPQVKDLADYIVVLGEDPGYDTLDLVKESQSML